MKKPRITVVLLIMLALVLASCSQDSAAGLGNIMSKMGNNVWGIKADTRKADAAAETVSKIDTKESVQDSAVADKLIESVKGFVGSDQNVEAFHSEMAKPATLEGTEFEDAVEDVSAKVDTIEDTQLKSAFENAMDSFEYISASSESLKNGDVVALTLVNSLLDEVTSTTATPESIAQKADDVLTVLKLSTGFSELNIIEDMDLSDILSNLFKKNTTKAISRDDSDSAVFTLLGKTFKKIASLMMSEGVFDKDKYARFHMEAKAIKLAYEVSMSRYIKGTDSIADAVKNIVDSSRPQTKASLDDLVMYICASVSCYVYKVPGLSADFLGEFLTNDVVKAIDDKNLDYLKNQAKDAIMTVLEPTDDTPKAIMKAVAVRVAYELKVDDETVENVIDPTMDFISDKEKASALADLLSEVLQKKSDIEIPAEVQNLIDSLKDALKKDFAKMEGEIKYFVCTSVGIFADAGFDSLVSNVVSLVERIQALFEDTIQSV